MSHGSVAPVLLVVLVLLSFLSITVSLFYDGGSDSLATAVKEPSPHKPTNEGGATGSSSSVIKHRPSTVHVIHGNDDLDEKPSHRTKSTLSSQRAKQTARKRPETNEYSGAGDRKQPEVAVSSPWSSSSSTNTASVAITTTTTSAAAWLRSPVRDVVPSTVVDLIKQVRGVPIEPIDVWIGKGGKRLRKIRLLASSDGFDWDGAKRRFVWFDLGARVWPKGSTQWFSRHYPHSARFEAECYDVLNLVSSYPRLPPFAKFRFHAKAAWIRQGTVTIGGVKMAHVKQDTEDLNKTKITQWKTESIDFAQLLLNNYTNKDFIVVKMDIEGGEWPLLKHLEETGALRRIDELMLECHPPSPEYATPTPDGSRKIVLRHGEMHPDCIRLINRMRLLNVFTHGWF